MGGSSIPAGTVTFLFLDIERSTELLQTIGGDYPQLLTLYRDLTEAAVDAHGGLIFGSEGDGLFVSFQEAGAGVMAAVEAQRAFGGAEWPGGLQTRVRMGVHTGTPTVVGDDYTGIDVHRAARIMSTAWGGQVVMSEATRLLAADRAISCVDLGWFVLKGLSRPEHIYQLEAEGLDSEFPPLRARRREVELPAFLTPMIGEEAQVATVVQLLEEGTRLVTLTGSGGIGKSRVATAAAALLDPGFADGVRYVDVSTESDSDHVMQAISERLGVVSDPNHPVLDRLIDHFEPLECLLVLDGFERVAAAAVQVSELLTRCPRLQVLITSRVALRLAAEREIRIESLGYPSEGAGFEEIAASPAVRLFMERAGAVRPGLDLSPENAPVIRDLVAHLNGVPLAIELAAARSRLLPPESLLERLGSVLDLAASSPELPGRQQSLRATIEWSHGLLSESDQILLRRLGVFVEGWTLEAAEAVGEGAADVFVGLENLVSQSMITVDVSGRMAMGTAMREFALEQLQAAGDEEETRLRHADFHCRLAGESEDALKGPQQQKLVAQLDPDWLNIRSASSWALATGRHELAALLYVNSWILAWQGDHWHQATLITEQYVRIADRISEPVRAKLLFVAAGTFMEIGDPRGLELGRAAVALAEKIGDRDTEAWARLMAAGSILFQDPLSEEARSQIQRAVATAREIGDEFLLGYALSFDGAISILHGDLETGRAAHLEVRDIATRLDNVHLVIQTYSQVAMGYLAGGDTAHAREALETAAESIDRMKSMEALTVFLDAVAWLAFAEDDKVRAMTSLGAAEAARARVGLRRWATIEGLLEGAGVAAEEGQPELAEARRAGAGMSPQEAIIFTLARHEPAPV